MSNIEVNTSLSASVIPQLSVQTRGGGGAAALEQLRNALTAALKGAPLKEPPPDIPAIRSKIIGSDELKFLSAKLNQP